MENDPQSPRQHIPVAVLGATGAVGQRFVQLLDEHPWFQVVALTGSDRAVGKKYAEACHWLLPTPMPAWAREMTVVSTLPEALDVTVAFSALPSKVAQEAEPLYAKHGVTVCSNASAFRNEPDVPLVLPEVNPDHTAMVEQQRQNRGWKGFIVTNANCTITGLSIVLKAH
jgi:aspartate-semialdehyde dehydrogenase